MHFKMNLQSKSADKMIKPAIKHKAQKHTT